MTIFSLVAEMNLGKVERSTISRNEESRFNNWEHVD